MTLSMTDMRGLWHERESGKTGVEPIQKPTSWALRLWLLAGLRHPFLFHPFFSTLHPSVSGDLRSIGVFGEELILWVCILRQAPRRPPADHLFKQANFLLDELKSSKAAQELPVVSVDDGLFVIAALLDQVAMSLPDLRPWWSQSPLQARRWMTNNAGVEVFERVERVRQGPPMVLATYVAVLGCGYLGKFGLGRDQYQLNQLRLQLARELKIDADRDIQGGAIKPYRYDTLPAEFIPREPWFKSVWMGRALAILLVLSTGWWVGLLLYWHFR
jgi:type VI secretion system protein ImpK